MFSSARFADGSSFHRRYVTPNLPLIYEWWVVNSEQL